MSDRRDFGIIGVERVTFAVEDLATACRYAADWGLIPVDGASANGTLFQTTDGCEVDVVPVGADHVPLGASSGLCEAMWGVRDGAALDAIAAELSTDRVVDLVDGVLRSIDDVGVPLAFRVTERAAVDYEPTRYNAPGQPMRVDRRGARYEQARPYEISHLAIAVDDAAGAGAFYVNRLGFHISDRYADRGMFLRCSSSGNHHHLFLMNGMQPGTRFSHLAFKVRDVHEVIAGGQAFDAKGWGTFAGPGRHRVSSANFWYFLTPFGGSWEYAADEDIVTEEWEPSDFAAEAHIFSEWTFGLEKSDGRLRGPVSQSRPAAQDIEV